jgi:hypothetical protein
MAIVFTKLAVFADASSTWDWRFKSYTWYIVAWLWITAIAALVIEAKLNKKASVTEK